MRPISIAVIHCSATPNGDSLFGVSPGTPGIRTPVETIDAWHRARGFRRGYGDRVRMNPNLESIGYHYVIYTNGVVATGRSPLEIGAHAKGHNVESLGICMIGTDRYSRAQWETLAEVCRMLPKFFPDIRILGHRDLSPDADGDGTVEPAEWLKTCPGFDVGAWLAGGMVPPVEHLLEAA